MQITLKTTFESDKRAHHTLQARFDKLRRQLERQQNRNRELASELDALVARYHSRLREADTRHLDPLVRLAERLIEFFSRKSLSNWQREELVEWITETIQRVQRVDGAAGEALHGRFRQTVAAFLEISEAQMDAEFEALAETLEAAFEEGFESASDGPGGAETGDDDDPQPDLFADRKFEFFDDDTDAGDDRDDPDPDAETRTRRLTDGSWARSLFRRAAQALHPDRETDPQQRAHKQVLMQRLLAARGEGDILTLLQLYGEAAAGADLALAEAEMTQACELMESRLAQLRDEQDEIVHAHPLRALVHELFYSSTGKTRERRFKAWEGELQSDAEAAAQLVGELRNLKVLKVFLEQRREQRIFSQFDDIVF